MSPKIKWSKVPWTTIAEFVLAWWKGRKKDDKGKTGSSVQPADNGTNLGDTETRPTK